MIKSHVRRYLNEGNDVATAAQFVQACLSHGGVKNVNVLECYLASGKKYPKLKISDIAKYHNFSFETDTVQVHRAWEVGNGKILKLKDHLNSAPYISALVSVQVRMPQMTLASSSHVGDSQDSSPTDDTDQTRDDKNINTQSKLFECLDDECIYRYHRIGNLIRHLTIGSHKYRIEKLSLMDLAMTTYKIEIRCC